MRARFYPFNTFKNRAIVTKHSLSMLIQSFKKDISRPFTAKTLGLSITLALSVVLNGCVGTEWPEEGKTPAPLGPWARPYKITNSFYKERWFTPQLHYELCERGIASFYGEYDNEHGGPTALGETYDKMAMTAAHRTLPLPCYVKVENLENGRSVKLKVNDRGPYAKDRVIDVSVKAAQLLGFYGKGTAYVRVTTLVQDSLELAQTYQIQKCKQFLKNGLVSCQKDKSIPSQSILGPKLVSSSHLSAASRQPTMAKADPSVLLRIKTKVKDHALFALDFLKKDDYHGLSYTEKKGTCYIVLGPISLDKAAIVRTKLTRYHPYTYAIAHKDKMKK